MSMEADDAEVLVTGATGLIGRWLLAALTRRGRRVAALVRGARTREAELSSFVARIGGDVSRLAVVEGDVELPRLGLEAPLPSVRVVHHLAARFAFRLDPEDARRTNVDGTRHAIDWASARPHLERFVLLGGYRMTKRDVSTLSAAAMTAAYREGAYEASKVEAYALFRRLVDERGLRWTAVHPSGLIGDSRTGETTQLVGLGETAKRLFDGELPALAGTARTFVPVVTVDYLAEYLATVDERAESVAKDLVVFHPDSPRLPVLVDSLARHLGVRAPTTRLPIGLLRALPTKWTGVEPESLRFLSEDDYDTAEGEAHARAVGLEHPSLDRALERWCDYLVSTRFLSRTNNASGGHLVRGVFTVGDPSRAEVVMLHGIPLDAEAMAPLASRLDAQSARVDLPGLGRSSPGATLDLDSLHAALGARTTAAIFVGHSLGAALAVRHADAHPNEVRALVLIAPSFLMKPASWTLSLRPIVARVLRGLDAKAVEARFLGEPATEEALVVATSAAAALARRGVAANYARALAEAVRTASRDETRDAFRAVRERGVPVLVVHTRAEPIVASTYGAEVVCLDAGGHNPHVTHADEVASHVRRFLAQAAPARKWA